MAKAANRGPLPLAFLRWATGGVIEDAAPLVGAWAKGAIIGLGVCMAAAALSHPIDRELRFVALLLGKVFEFYPIAAAGVLIGGAIGLIWSQRNSGQYGCRTRGRKDVGEEGERPARGL